MARGSRRSSAQAAPPGNSDLAGDCALLALGALCATVVLAAVATAFVSIGWAVAFVLGWLIVLALVCLLVCGVQLLGLR